MGGILNAIDISARGLSVQRAKMNVVAKNIANAETTETKEGGPYRRQRVVVTEDREKVGFRTLMKKAGARLARTSSGHMRQRGTPETNKMELSKTDARIITDPESSFKVIHDPTHPQADAEGYVRLPDIEIINEMVDMMSASRAYEANTVAISAAKNMARDALEI